MIPRMPRLDPKVLNCVCFLYPTREDAEAGQNFGGTAFLVSIPSAVPGRTYVAAVSNWHVACRGHSVLRLNTQDGGTQVIVAGPEEWLFDPRYDIAVLPLTFEESDNYRRSQVKTTSFVTTDYLSHEKGIGPGEDVFMLGRFIDHDGGRDRNLPTVRFGHISAMPTPIVQENHRKAPAFIVDMHSRSGYSGSPVFVYRTPGFDLQLVNSSEPRLLLDTPSLFALLGIHVGQFPEDWEIVSGTAGAKKAAGDGALIVEGAAVRGFSGMTCVLPAWCIQEVLDLPVLKEARDRRDTRILAAESAPNRPETT